MSTTSQSKTEVVKVKGVSFNYVQFLWSSLGTVKQAQAKGLYSEAMRLIAELVTWLPDSIKEDFRNKAVMISHTMQIIKTGQLKMLQKIPDYFIKGIVKNRILQNYCSKAFQTFIDELGTQLNSLGYMENVEKIQEGEDDWFGERRRETATKKRKEEKEKKRKEADKFSELP